MKAKYIDIVVDGGAVRPAMVIENKVKVWDPIANYYTSCHSLSDADCAKIVRAATANKFEVALAGATALGPSAK